MSYEQWKQFIEMLRLDYIDVIREELNVYSTGIREMVICFRAFPGGEAFYSPKEMEFLKEIGLVQPDEQP